ncbi:MAG TPA: ABC transporter ATP-binding protein [Tepidisphaeraceae bacterium]|nr:ABC transporter ATP-binding protein [Tepidisphaeraceae bacterium]
MANLLHATNLTFAYSDEPVLRNVTLSLAAGEVVALFGPNGSGKSTLIQLLLGALRGVGEISWHDKPIAAYRRNELAKLVAYLPQSPAMEPSQRVSEVIGLGRLPYWGAFGIESARDAEVVERVAEQLSLTSLLSRRMDELSGGQRQRVFLGRCLAQEPRALLLDEPSTFLDLRHQVDLHQLLRRLARDQQMGILMASHDLNLTALHADRAIVLHEGHSVADGLPEAVLSPELLARVYGVLMQRVMVGGESHLVVAT